MTITILADKSIILGVTGSIACYKVVDLASKLTQAGANVEVILTEAAQRFVSPLSFQSVTGRPAFTDMWSLRDHVQHVRLAESADLLVVAPATAHTLAKLAQGLADNLLTLTALAARCPLLLAPAMDGGMFGHPTTQANLQTLRQRGATVAGPAEGRLASGLTGPGRLLEAADLLAHIRLVLAQGGPLKGRHVVVTAGPTQEPIDPVRFVSNHSSGKQGLALAQAALDAGAQVTLISGPIQLAEPVGVRHISVQTAQQMCDSVLEAVADAEVLLMAAAVSDFRPETAAGHKLKKNQASDTDLVIQLARNPDILKAVQAQKAVTGLPAVAVGFAAETRNVVAYGREKLIRKGLDYIAVNDVSSSDAGFAVDTNRIVLLGSDGLEEDLPLQSKASIAEHIVRVVARVLEKEA